MSGSNEHSGSAPEGDGACGPGGVNGVGVVARGQPVVARRDDLLRDGRLQTGHQRKEQRKRRTEQRNRTDGLYFTGAVQVSGARYAATLFATEAQGRAHEDARREFFTRIADFTWLARASSTVNVH
jgi:hypothetical protein